MAGIVGVVTVGGVTGVVGVFGGDWGLVSSLLHPIASVPLIANSHKTLNFLMFRLLSIASNYVPAARGPQTLIHILSTSRMSAQLPTGPKWPATAPLA